MRGHVVAFLGCGPHSNPERLLSEHPSNFLSLYDEGRIHDKPKRSRFLQCVLREYAAARVRSREFRVLVRVMKQLEEKEE